MPGSEAPVTHLTYPRELAAGLFRGSADGNVPRRLIDHWRVLRADGPLSASTADGPLTYVTRGVGMGIVPVRILCPPELAVFELVRDDERGDGADDAR